MVRERADFAGFESVRRLYRVGPRSVSAAQRKTAPGKVRYAIHWLEPREPDGTFPTWSEEESAARVDCFLRRAKLQQVAASAGAGWAPVHALDTTGRGAAFVSDLYPRSVQRVARLRTFVDERGLHNVARSVALALQALRSTLKRGHGCLHPAKVLIGAGPLARARVVLTGPADTLHVLLSQAPPGKPGSSQDRIPGLPTSNRAGPAAASTAARAGKPGPEDWEAADLHGLGLVLFELVMQRPFEPGKGWHDMPSSRWSALGGAGPGWRGLCSQLLNPAPEERLGKLDHLIEALPPSPRRRVPGTGKAAAMAAGVGVCAAGVLAYQKHWGALPVASNNDKPLVIMPAPPLPPAPGATTYVAKVTPPATTPTDPAVDAARQWARFVDTLPTPALPGTLLPAWEADRNRFRLGPSRDPFEVSNKLQALATGLNAFDRALVEQMQGLPPALAASAAVKRQELLKKAADAITADVLASSPSAADFPNNTLSPFEREFGDWVTAHTLLEEANTALSQRNDEDAALKKLDELKQMEPNAQAVALRNSADTLRKKVMTAKDGNLKTGVLEKLATEEFAEAIAQFDALKKFDPSYPTDSLQKEIDDAEAKVVKRANGLWLKNKDAEALKALDGLLNLRVPYADAVALKGKISDAQQVLAAAADLLKKHDSADLAAASKLISNFLRDQRDHAAARQLRDDIVAEARAQGQKDVQEGDFDAAIASCKVVGDLLPADAATQTLIAELSGAKGLLDDALKQMSFGKWQSAAKDLTALGAKPEFAPAANLNWPVVEKGLIADAKSAGDAASWKAAIAALDPKRQSTWQVPVVKGLLDGAERKVYAPDANDARAHDARALLDQAEGLLPKDPAARDALDKAVLLQSAVDAESNGDYAGAASAYSEVSRLDPGNADCAGRAKQCSEYATKAATLEKSARASLNAGDPITALKTIDDSSATLRKALTKTRTEITNLQANAQKFCDMGNAASSRKAFAEAFSDFWASACGGSPQGMLQLGDAYKNGQGVKADENQATLWWQRAKNAGNPEASGRLKPAEPTAAPSAPNPDDPLRRLKNNVGKS